MKPSIADKLRSRWDYLCGKVWADNRHKVFEALDSHYSEPHRYYHNWAHIADSFDKLDDIDSSGYRLYDNDLIVIEFAIWFHDAIYDTKEYDNEDKSARLFLDLCRDLNPDSFHVDDQDLYWRRKDVTKLIRGTKEHKPTRSVRGRVLFDIDLSILGSSNEEFDEYDSCIKAEYHWVPPDIFSAHRSKFMSDLLNRKRIFQTRYFHDKYEEQARNNLRRAVSKYGSALYIN